MSGRKAGLLVIILAGIFGLLSYFVAIRGPVTAPSTDIGAVSRGLMAPGFELPDLAGRKVSLEDFRGQFVLINFWATWCQPCLEEMPSLQALHERFRDRKLVVLAVNLNETSADLQDYLAKAGITFPILLDGQAVATRYGTEKVPESYLVDHRGIVLNKIIGAQDWTKPEALAEFDRLLPQAGS